MCVVNIYVTICKHFFEIFEQFWSVSFRIASFVLIVVISHQQMLVKYVTQSIRLQRAWISYIYQKKINDVCFIIFKKSWKRYVTLVKIMVCDHACVTVSTLHNNYPYANGWTHIFDFNLCNNSYRLSGSIVSCVFIV